MNTVERTIKYLNAHTNAIVSHDTPTYRRDIQDLVIVFRSGGYQNRFVDNARLLIDCHSTTSEKAYALAEEIFDILIDFPDNDLLVSDVDINSIYRNQWYDGSPCYTLNCAIFANKD